MFQMCDRRKQAWAAVFIGNVLIHTAVIASPIYVPQFQPGSKSLRSLYYYSPGRVSIVLRRIVSVDRTGSDGGFSVTRVT